MTFDEIAGLENVKETCLDYVRTIQHIELAKQRGLKTGGVMLFFGPPGTGKTMLARAVAGELGLPFYIAKCSELLSKWVGESTKNLAALFEQARSEPNGAVVFFDEIDNLASKRSGNTHEVSLQVLTQLLTELDGADSANDKLVFLAATNFPWNLDDALMSRIKEKCYVPLPDAAARRAIIEMTLAKSPTDNDVNLEELTEQTDGLGGREIANLCERAKLIAFRDVVKSGIDRGVNAADLTTAMENVRPSVSEKEIQKYENWAKG